MAILMVVLRDFFGFPRGFPCYFSWISVQFLWDFYWILRVLLDFDEVSLESLWRFYGIVVGCLCNCYRISIGFLWDFHDMSMMFLLDYGVSMGFFGILMGLLWHPSVVFFVFFLIFL